MFVCGCLFACLFVCVCGLMPFIDHSFTHLPIHPPTTYPPSPIHPPPTRSSTNHLSTLTHPPTTYPLIYQPPIHSHPSTHHSFLIITHMFHGRKNMLDCYQLFPCSPTPLLLTLLALRVLKWKNGGWMDGEVDRWVGILTKMFPTINIYEMNNQNITKRIE